MCHLATPRCDLDQPGGIRRMIPLQNSCHAETAEGLPPEADLFMQDI